MKLTKDPRFYKFFIPSFIGIFLFIVPINLEGNLTIPIAVAANKMLSLMGEYTFTIVWALISVSALITILHRYMHFPLLKRNPKIDSLFNITGFWFWTRMVGFLFANMIYFNLDPDFIIGELTGGLVINDLIPILVCVFLLAGVLLALRLNYGLLDFLGALLIKFCVQFSISLAEALWIVLPPGWVMDQLAYFSPASNMKKASIPKEKLLSLLPPFLQSASLSVWLSLHRLAWSICSSPFMPS